MKKIILVLAAALSVIACLSFTACTAKEETDSRLTYEMKLSLSENVICGEQTVKYRNVYVDGLGQSVFHLYANAYSENSPNPAYNASLLKYGGIEIESVTVNGAPSEYALSDNGQYLTVKHDALSRNEEISIGFVYKTTVPSGNLRLGCGENAYTLSGFYPQLSVYDGDAFRTDAFYTVGDPVFSDCADYKVTFECDSRLVACSSLKTEGIVTSGNRQTLTLSGSSMRDVAIICNTDFNVISSTCGDVSVYYFYETDDEAQATLELAVNALRVFGEAFGDYPYEVYTVARAPFMCDGMEFSGLSLIGKNCTDTENAVLHETAHQWWYGTVGSDCINESYMDEGLATFCAAYYYSLIGDEGKFEGEIASIKRGYTGYERLQQKRKDGGSLAMNKPIYEFTEYKYTMVEYYKSCMMFDCIRELYGKDKFNECLKAYAKEYRFAIGGREAFVKVADGVLGDISGLMEGWISEKVVATTFAAE